MKRKPAAKKIATKRKASPGRRQPSTLPTQPGTQWSEKQLHDAIAPLRVGRSLLPGSWPGGARAAVCISWDMDNESFELAAGNTLPIPLSWGEYGMRQATPRIMELYERYDIPGSFYIPAVCGVLYPEMTEAILKSGRHEIGVHGWIHERLPALDRAEERRLLKKSLDFWTKTLGKKPVGFRAPGWAFSANTLDLLREAEFEYESSAMGMDDPYEIVSHGKPTGMVELPVDWSLTDSGYFWLPGGALPSPEVVFRIFQDEFDVAYQEGSMFMLTMHPMISGRRARFKHLDRLIAYIKSKPGVWFATGQQIADYVRKESGL